MKISLQNIGKKWGREWLYRHLNLVILPGKPVVFLGTNGSGKSTLLKITAGLLSPSEGTVVLKWKNEDIPPAHRYLYTSFAAPYLQIYEDLNLSEAFVFHNKLKKLEVESLAHFCDYIGLKTNNFKPISSYSSGMKQRVKLGFALLSSSPFVFLDEPCSNLDESGAKMYQNALYKCINSGKIVVIASNADSREYPSTSEAFQVQNFGL